MKPYIGTGQVASKSGLEVVVINEKQQETSAGLVTIQHNEIVHATVHKVGADTTLGLILAVINNHYK